MLVPCRSLFMGEADRLPLEAELDLTQVELFGNHPFRRPVRVTGACRSGDAGSAGAVSV